MRVTEQLWRFHIKCFKLNNPIFFRYVVFIIVFQEQDTGFPLTERDRLGLRGLLPPRVISFEQQYDRFSEFHCFFTPFNLPLYLLTSFFGS